MLHTRKDMFILLCWPTQEPCGWMLARHALTFQSGWLSPRQVREPTDMRHTALSGLLQQLWALRARPDAVRHLRAYRHLPPFRWLTDLARAAVFRRQTHYAAEVDSSLQDMAFPQDCRPIYRHPWVRRRGPLLPGCVVVVDVPVDRGCPILTWPPPPDAPVPAVHRDTPCFRGGTTLLVVAAEHDSAFAVDSTGRFG